MSWALGEVHSTQENMNLYVYLYFLHIPYNSLYGEAGARKGYPRRVAPFPRPARLIGSCALVLNAALCDWRYFSFVGRMGHEIVATKHVQASGVLHDLC